MEEIKTALKDTMYDILEIVDQNDSITEEYVNGVKAVATLNDAILDIEKLESEKEQTKLEILKIAADCVKALLTFAGGFGLTILVMKFEENGILRSKVWSWIPKLWNSKM